MKSCDINKILQWMSHKHVCVLDNTANNSNVSLFIKEKDDLIQ